MGYKIGVDVGGTFTDAFLIDERGNLHIGKSPSTPQDASIGVLNCIEKIAGTINLSLSDLLDQVDVIVHGTTAATNAILTLSGAKTGLITTKGFRDSLEIRRGHKDEGMFNIKVGPPPQLVPRQFRIAVEERIDYQGTIITPLKEDDVRKAVEIFKKEGITSIAICLLFSFMNPVHEKRIEEMIQEEYPKAYVCRSSFVLPVIREYERTSTTALSAYVGPLLDRYLRNLEEKLKQFNYKHTLLLMHSGGGVMTSSAMRKRAVNAVASGPAAAPSAGLAFAEIYDIQNYLTIDMGGTSFDICPVIDRKIVTTYESIVARYHVAIPIVNIHTTGAGGGSIAWIDTGGLFHVGPQSAGSIPGPACYGRGGELPTVTDANLILGYINPDYFLGGEMKLNRKAAENALKKVADPLNISLVAAAHAVFSIVNNNMVDAISNITVRRGDDPRDFTLITAGGAGPIHAGALASGMGINRIIIPKLSSVFCAFGMLSLDLKYNFIRTYPIRISRLKPSKANELFLDMEQEGNKFLEDQGVHEKDRYFLRSVDMRYVGQVRELEAEVPSGEITDFQELADNFHKLHEKLYAYCEPEMETEVVNFRVLAGGKIPRIQFPKQTYTGEDPAGSIKGERMVFIPECKKLVKTPIYDGNTLAFGNIIKGPGIIEEQTTTIVAFPGTTVEVDEYGNYVEKIGSS